MNPLGWNPSRELAEMSDRLNRVIARVPRGGNENEAMPWPIGPHRWTLARRLQST